MPVQSQPKVSLAQARSWVQPPPTPSKYNIEEKEYAFKTMNVNYLLLKSIRSPPNCDKSRIQRLTFVVPESESKVEIRILVEHITETINHSHI